MFSFYGTINVHATILTWQVVMFNCRFPKDLIQQPDVAVEATKSGGVHCTLEHQAVYGFELCLSQKSPYLHVWLSQLCFAIKAHDASYGSTEKETHSL